MSDVLVLSGDEALRTDIVRLVGPVDAREPGAAVRPAWRAAAVVLVGTDALPALAAAQLPRRARVVLVCRAVPTTEEWRDALELGVERVLGLPGDERLLVDSVAGPAEPAQLGRVVAVIGGSGGAGASTTAATLARLGAGRAATVLVDADPCSGGLDVLLGVENWPGRRWADLPSADAVGRPADFRAGLLAADGLHVLSHGFGALHRPPAPVVRAVIDALRRAFDLVVVDLPRGFDTGSELWLAAAELVLVVVKPTVRAVAAAATVVRTLAGRGTPVQVVLRRGAGSALSAADVQAGLQVPVFGVVRDESTIAAAADRGLPPLTSGRSRRRGGSLGVLCAQVLEQLLTPVAA